MHLAANVFDVWAFQRTDADLRFLLLHTSEEKARRHFSGGRFWQIPSGFVDEGEAHGGDILRANAGKGSGSPTTMETTS